MMNSIFHSLFINSNGEPVRLLLAVLLSSLASVYSGTVKAQISDDLVRIGVLNDQSGVYADFGGPGLVIAAVWRLRMLAAKCWTSRSIL